MDFDYTCEVLHNYYREGLFDEDHPKLSKFYLEELLIPKHEFLMTKRGGNIS